MKTFIATVKIECPDSSTLSKQDIEDMSLDIDCIAAWLEWEVIKVVKARPKRPK